MKKKRLSDIEIRSAVNKIRARYTDYVSLYKKDPSPAGSFEDRYIQAMRQRVDMELFLHAELSAIEDLIKLEETRAAAAENRTTKYREKKEQKQDFADRVLEEYRRRIAKYPSLEIHIDASEEVEKLYGTLGTFERQLWPDLGRFIRKAYPSAVNNPRARLEEQILTLCSSVHGGVPTHVARYKSLHEWSNPDSPEIVKEERKVLLDAAFFLFDLLDVFSEMLRTDNLEPWERENVEKMNQYVHTVVTDFRLKEFRSLRP